MIATGAIKRFKVTSNNGSNGISDQVWAPLPSGVSDKRPQGISRVKAQKPTFQEVSNAKSARDGLRKLAHIQTERKRLWPWRKRIEKARDFKRIVKIFLEMKISGIPPTTVSYNFLLHQCAKNEWMQYFDEIFVMMQNDGILPDVVNWGTVITAYAKNLDRTRALARLDEMKREGITPTLLINNCLLNMASKLGDQPLGELLFLDIRRNGLCPDLFSYTSMFTMTKSLERAQELWTDMEQVDKLVPDLICYQAFLGACARHRGLDLAFSAYDQMLDQGLEPNEDVFWKLLSACEYCGDFAASEEIVEDMEQRGFPRSVALRAKVVATALSSGEPEKAHLLLKELRGWEQKPNVSTLHHLMQVFTDAGYPKTALSIFEDACSFRFDAEEELLIDKILALGRIGKVEASEEIFMRMVADGILTKGRGPIALLNLLKVNSEVGNVERSQEILETMKARFDLEPQDFHFEAAVNGFYSKGNLKASLEVFRIADDLPCASVGRGVFLLDLRGCFKSLGVIFCAIMDYVLKNVESEEDQNYLGKGFEIALPGSDGDLQHVKDILKSLSLRFREKQGGSILKVNQGQKLTLDELFLKAL